MASYPIGRLSVWRGSPGSPAWPVVVLVVVVSQLSGCPVRTRPFRCFQEGHPHRCFQAGHPHWSFQPRILPNAVCNVPIVIPIVTYLLYLLEHLFAFFYETAENLFFANNNIVIYRQKKKPERPEGLFQKERTAKNKIKKKQQRTHPKPPKLLTKKQSKIR